MTQSFSRWYRAEHAPCFGICQVQVATRNFLELLKGDRRLRRHETAAGSDHEGSTDS
jgi:hypothetical protein